MTNPFALGELASFGGWCRYGSDERNWIESVTVSTYIECEQVCRGNTKCVAFSYKANVNNNCNLYEGGPYTYGDGRTGTACYILGGKLLL